VVRHDGPPRFVKLQPARDGKWQERDTQVARNALKVLLDPRTDPRLDLQALHRQRLRPLETHLDGVKRLIILPSSAMAGIPIEAMTDRYLISYAPSATIYAWLREKRAERPAGAADLLALGDPAFSAAPAKVAITTKDGLLAQLVRGENLKPLPGTRAEVESIARLFQDRKSNVVKFLGVAASGPSLDRLATTRVLGRFRYLHLATHGFADLDGGLNSYLALTAEGSSATHAKLSAGQIMRTWKLDADLVTLSACQTALGELRGGEGYVGFAQALLFAGTRSLVLTQWKVDDQATTLFMHRFYQNLLNGNGNASKSEALAEAGRWLRGLDKDEAVRRLKSIGVPVNPDWVQAAEARPFEHPNYWSAFILIGDPGR